jgi:ATP/ADP translocase/HEAT repeat protein
VGKDSSAGGGRSSFGAYLRSALSIEPGEGRRTALLFSYLLLASAVFILGRTVRDTLFLSRYPLSALPWMFVLYGVASAITVVLYSQFADRMARHRLVLGSTALAGATYLGTWLLVRQGATWIYPAFYVWSEVAANLLIVQFWTLANDLHDLRSARRLFPTIGAARILGVVVIGLVTGAIVRALGTPQLLLVLVGMLAGIGLLAWILRREPRPAAPEARTPRGRPPRVIGNPYVRALSLVTLLAFTALTLGDYQFKAIARATFVEDELATFFSLFYAGTGIVSFVFQLWATPRILRRFGVSAGMSVMPAVFGGASAFLLGLPHLAVATVLKFADNGFQYTIHETTLQALYAPFAPQVKARTRAFLDAVIKPLSYGVGGLLLVFLVPRMEVVALSWVTLVLVVVWLGLIPLVRRRYLTALGATLTTRGALELETASVDDAEARRAVLAALASGDPRVVAVALEQSEGLRGRDLLPTLVQLSARPQAAVRAIAIRRLGAFPEADPTPAIQACADADAEVRAAGAGACAALCGDDCLEHLVPLLDDEDRSVRTAALAGILLRGGVEGAIVGGGRLARLLESPARGDREEAARAMDRLGGAAYRPVRSLLEDPEPGVRRAALRAARHTADARLIPPLLAALRVRSTQTRAGAALVAIGEPAARPLLGMLLDPIVPRRVRLIIPRLLRQIPSPKVYRLLRDQAELVDSPIRLRVLAALSALRSQLGLNAEPLSWVLARVAAEHCEAYGNEMGWEAARKRYQTPLLTEQIAFRRRRWRRRVLHLLTLRYDRTTLHLVRRALGRPAQRAGALELLDTLLEPSLRLLVLPPFEGAPLAERLEAVGLQLVTPDGEAFLISWIDHPNPFVVAVTLQALASHPTPASLRAAVEALEHADSLVREEALRTCLTCDPDGFAERATAFETDDNHKVAQLARAGAEADMPSTLERILLLKSASIFEQVAAEDLAPIAHASDWRSYRAGEEVFAQGDMGDELFVLVSGKVAVIQSGQELAQLGPGEAFGEMAVLDAEPRSATIRCLEDTEVLAIGSEEFYEVLHEQMEIAEGVLRMLTRRLRRANTPPQAPNQEA